MLICSLSWRKADVETIRRPCGLEDRRKRTNCWRLVLQAQPKKNKTALSCSYWTRCLRTLNGDLLLQAKPGDRVLAEAHAGIDVKDGDEKYIIVGLVNILATEAAHEKRRETR